MAGADSILDRVLEAPVVTSFTRLGFDVRSRLDHWRPINSYDLNGRTVLLTGGTGFVEITNPSQPVVVGHVTGPTSLWRCVKTYGTYCYAGSEGGNGIQVIDMSNIDGTNAALPPTWPVSVLTVP